MISETLVSNQTALRKAQDEVLQALPNSSCSQQSNIFDSYGRFARATRRNSDLALATFMSYKFQTPHNVSRLQLEQNGIHDTVEHVLKVLKQHDYKSNEKKLDELKLEPLYISLPMKTFLALVGCLSCLSLSFWVSLDISSRRIFQNIC